MVALKEGAVVVPRNLRTGRVFAARHGDYLPRAHEATAVPNCGTLRRRKRKEGR
jgi:hypothetical protein